MEEYWVAGKVCWVSPKGYGFVELDDGTNVFVPSHIMKEASEEQDISVKYCTGMLGLIAIDLQPRKPCVS
jgi:cold shock CspA family protein